MEELLNILGNHFPDGLSAEKRSDIMNFLSERLYNEYNDYRMNKELVIRNRIDALDIALPNAKAGEDYSQLIKIEDKDIIEYWVEGLEEAGLTVVSEIVLKSNLELPLGNSLTENTEMVEEFESGKMKTEEDSEGSNNREFSAILGTPTKGILVKGIPTVAGDFDITLKYKYNGWLNGDSIPERKFKFAVNPDPRLLWKDISTDENIKFFKKDYISDYVIVEENDKGSQKDIVAASKRGRSHAHEGKARDDDFQLFHNDENGWYVIVVADGAGSAKYSRKGSEVACKTSLEYCKQVLASPEELENAIFVLNSTEEGISNRAISTLIYNIVGGAAHKAHRAILEVAKANDDQARDYSTTLLLAICKKFDFGWFVASFWVGDGAMCIYDKDRQYIRLLGTPDGGEYAGQTRFLTMKEIFTPESIMSRLKYSIEEDFSALILMTDGISDPFFETDANLNRVEKWNALWDNINSEVDLTDDNSESQYQLLKWLDFWSPGNHDDRTIAILY